MFLEVNRIKKKFRSATLLLLYQIKLNITRQNGYAKQNIILLHFLGNKPRRFLSLRSFYFMPVLIEINLATIDSCWYSLPF